MKITAVEKQNEYGLSFVEIRGCEEFETAHIFECGQCFRWNFLPDGKGGGDLFFGVAGGKAVAISTFCDNGKKVIVIANSKLRDFNEFWYDYFDFGRDYSCVISELSEKDSHLKQATEFGKGIRILRQEKFETLISFILSANNNKISDISPLKDCAKLTVLDLSSNTIGSLDALASHTNMTYLKFAHNQVTELPTWNDSAALVTIDGSYNLISDLSPLGNLKNINNISMDYNENIQSVEALANCPVLIQVNVFGTKVTDVKMLTDQSIIVNYNPIEAAE